MHSKEFNTTVNYFQGSQGDGEGRGVVEEDEDQEEEEEDEGEEEEINEVSANQPALPPQYAQWLFFNSSFICILAILQTY